MLFNRLQFNFDTTKFGDSNNLNDKNKQFLDAMPKELSDWQKSDLANGSYTSTNYYQNPLSANCDSMKGIVDNISSRLDYIEVYDYITTDDVANLKNTLITLSSEITKFKSHTSNVSGVTDTFPSFDGLDYPDYHKTIAIGQQLLFILNETDGVQNATPMLGSMTSLFVKTEVESNTTILTTDYTTVNNSIRLAEYPDGEGGSTWNVTSNLAYSVYNTIVSHVQTANTLIGGRREHDWTFYRNGVALIDDYNRINRLSKVGSTQNYILTNLNGTSSYLDKLSGNT